MRLLIIPTFVVCSFALRDPGASGALSPPAMGSAPSIGPGDLPDGFLAPAKIPEYRVDHKKPQVTEELVNYFPRFMEHPKGEWITCQQVLDEVGFESPAYIALQNLILYLERELHAADHSAAISVDKNVQAALKELNSHVMGSDNDEENDRGLLPFIPKLISCDADRENGRSIYQLLWEFGLTLSLKELFVTEILEKGIEDYKPHLQLDRKGNTLMHLTAMSRQPTLLTLLDSRMKKNFSDMAHHTFYMLASFNQPNSDGLKPLELADSQMLRRMKTRFRNLAEFAKGLLEHSRFSSNTMQQLRSTIVRAEGALASKPPAALSSPPAA